jgi:hypothetical protein
VPQGLLDRKAHPELQELLAPKVVPESLGQQDPPAHKVLLELLGRLVLRVRREVLGLQVLQDRKAHPGLQAPLDHKDHLV